MNWLDAIVVFGFFFFPLFITALVHHFIIIPTNTWKFLSIPIDAGITFRSKPVFGQKKTWRGFFIMMFGTAFLSWLYASLFPAVSSLLNFSPFVSGFIVGGFYGVGELPTSFLKRRYNLASSQQLNGWSGFFFYMLEQIDSIVFVGIAILCVVHDIRLWISVWTSGLFIGILLHMGVDTLLYYAGYKRSIGKPYVLKILEQAIKK